MDAVFKLLKVVKDTRLIEKGDSIIVGVSGGIDSVVLLDALSRLQCEYRLKLYVAHVNYGLRGKESDRDERFVKGLAKKYGIPPFVKGGKGGILPGTNLQNTARDLRYDFFLKTAKKLKANKIAVAHHANDQAETILIHLTRGSGPSGLVGMSHTSSPPLMGGDKGEGGILLIRPLLSVTKDDILAYAKERRLKHVQDRTNRTKKYHRNVIRHDLLPLLKRYNPNIVQHLCKTAAILRDEDAALNEIAVRFCHPRGSKRGSHEQNCMHEIPAFAGMTGRRGNDIKFKRSRFLKHHITIQRRALRLAYAGLTGGTADLLTDHIDKMIWIITSGKKEGQYTLPKGIKFVRRGNTFTLKRR